MTMAIIMTIPIVDAQVRRPLHVLITIIPVEDIIPVDITIKEKTELAMLPIRFIFIEC